MASCVVGVEVGNGAAVCEPFKLTGGGKKMVNVDLGLGA